MTLDQTSSINKIPTFRIINSLLNEQILDNVKLFLKTPYHLPGVFPYARDQ